tara:strand:- start:194 stop:760 length:567 start_codon:yes stop_codon:yes gene_type:complete
VRKYFYIVLIFLLEVALAVKQHLPDIALKDLSNKRQKISQYYKDGPVLMNFWNLACEPCKKEMKELDKINIKYRDTGFDYVSINIDSPRSMSKVKSYINSQKFSFTVLSDPKAGLFRRTGGKVMPFVIIADSTGAIVSQHVGYNPGDEKKLEKEIVHLLGMPVLGDTVHTDLEIITKDTTSIISPENK